MYSFSNIFSMFQYYHGESFEPHLVNKTIKGRALRILGVRGVEEGVYRALLIHTKYCDFIEIK